MKKQVFKSVVKYKPLSAENDSAFKTEHSLDTMTFSGSYLVEINHNGTDVGLPIEDCGKEHYIVGTLVVTDSGTAGRKQSNRVIGQVLMLTSRENKETKIYSRTFADGCWGNWRSLALAGMFNNISTTDELVATVEELVAETKSIKTGLSSEITRSQNAYDSIKKNAIQSGSFLITPNADSIKATYCDIDGSLVSEVSLPVATEENAGVMSAEDKGIVARGKNAPAVSVVEDMLVQNPARKGGGDTASDSYRGYEIDLNGFYENGIRNVLLRVASYSSNNDGMIIPAVVYDTAGEVEYELLNQENNYVQNYWEIIPITVNSAKIRVSYGVKVWPDGKAGHIFTPSVVYLLNTVDSLIAPTKEIVDPIQTIVNGGEKVETYLKIIGYPARKDGGSTTSGSYKGYEVDLSKFRNIYTSVYFKGSSYTVTSDIVKGIIIDDYGNVESVVETVGNYTNGWQELPLTPKSAKLRATYCFANEYVNNEVFTPEYVVIKRENGLKQSINGNTHCQTVSFQSSYQMVELATIIRKGELVRVTGDFTAITCRTNSSDTGYATIKGEAVADRDIRYIKNATDSGIITIESTSVGLMQRVEELEKPDVMDVFLPPIIYVMNGRTTQLFYRGFIKAVDPYVFDIKVKCALGKAYRRYYELNPVSVGEYPITIEVRDSYKNILGRASSVIKVVESNRAIADKNILCCGASATVSGYWPGELQRMLNGGSDMYSGLGLGVKFVGRKKGAGDATVLLEATGGWSWETFISTGLTSARFTITSLEGEITVGTRLNLAYNGETYSYTVQEVNLTDGAGNIRCAGINDYNSAIEPPVGNGTFTAANGSTLEFSSYVMEAFVPFYNSGTGKIDFKTYADTYCNGRIDILIAHMGVNNMLWENSSIPKDYIRNFIDGYLKDFPDGKVVIVAIPMPDYGTNTYANTQWDNNINRYGTLCSFLDYDKYLENFTKEYSGQLFYAPANIFFDTDYAYPKSNRGVNTRISSITEDVDVNGVHPVKEGSYMVADGILPTLMSMS